MNNYPKWFIFALQYHNNVIEAVEEKKVKHQTITNATTRLIAIFTHIKERRVAYAAAVTSDEESGDSVFTSEAL